MTIDKPTCQHPFPANLILKPLNISDPKDFLTIKRFILQYVWVKPLLYLIITIGLITGWYDTNDVSWTSLYLWTGIAYNLSVTFSLYYLAIFWKCLYDELKVFHPIPKFLCVKLIIFASYWQGLFIAILNFFGVFKDIQDAPEDGSEPVKDASLGVQIQNGLLCLEMIFFAWLHWKSFPYTDFTADKYPNSARFRTKTALKDWTSIGDLIYDLKTTTMYGDSYNFRNFDSANDRNLYTTSATFNQKIYQGLRYSADGKKYWIPNAGSAIGAAGGSSSSNVSSKSPPKSSHNNFRSHHMNRNSSSNKLSIDQKTPLLGSSSTTSSPNRVKYIDSLDSDNDAGLLFFNGEDTDNNSTLSSSHLSNVDPETILQSDEAFAKDEKLYRIARSKYITEDKIKYLVEYNYGNAYSNKINSLREQLNEIRHHSNNEDAALFRAV
ncbi:unnamed protein product [Ambrosiozyma monospora]|uniref:Unnamed protein product n=1 Tax=Ambrosiozyma monospora TaxID=43982 RepID=A0ACB5T925_AMBMO|nr:unnamed protein product [Ambrosiozyma monospora]